jgi:hypothetical protein
LISGVLGGITGPMKAAASAAKGAEKATACPSAGQCFVAGTQVVLAESDVLFAQAPPCTPVVADASASVLPGATDAETATWWDWVRENRQALGLVGLAAGLGLTLRTAPRRRRRGKSGQMRDADLVDAALDEDDDEEDPSSRPWDDPRAWDWATDMTARFQPCEFSEADRGGTSPTTVPTPTAARPLRRPAMIPSPTHAAAPARRRPVRLLGLALAVLGAALLLGGESRPTPGTVAPAITRAALTTPAPANSAVALAASKSATALVPRTRSINMTAVRSATKGRDT